MAEAKTGNEGAPSGGSYRLRPSVCPGRISAQRERERGLGQGDRGGGGPEGRAAEGNAGPAPFLVSLVELRRWAEILTRHTLGAVFKLNQCSVRGKSRSAKATEADAGQRPVPPRATPAQLDFPLTRRAQAERRFNLKTAPNSPRS